MRTTHTLHTEDARNLSTLDTDSVHLVVTSPPYPMIKMWDDLFTSLNPEIEERLTDDPEQAFELMHSELDKVWDELERVVAPNGYICINIGDATRTFDSFRRYPNTERIVSAFDDRGFTPLPKILWRKPTNRLNKFMGSGMIPPNAYVSQEHESILIFRNGTDTRNFDGDNSVRYTSAYFWEERNDWFSDLWDDVQGARQSLSEAELRDRSAAYPFEIPYRLVNMFSVHGDTVLDPFVGTGTTSLAAATSARNSIGFEIDPEFKSVFVNRLQDSKTLSESVCEQRLTDHFDFVSSTETAFQYTNSHYSAPVKTQQETDLRLFTADDVEVVQSAPTRVDVDHGVYSRMPVAQV